MGGSTSRSSQGSGRLATSGKLLSGSFWRSSKLVRISAYPPDQLTGFHVGDLAAGHWVPALDANFRATALQLMAGQATTLGAYGKNPES